MFSWVVEAAGHSFDLNYTRALIVREAAVALGGVAQEIPGGHFQVLVKTDHHAGSAGTTVSASVKKPKIGSDK